MRLDEERVYEALNHEWKSGEEIYQSIRRGLGVDRLSFFGKLVCLVNFEYPDINKLSFYIHIANLRAQEAIELRKEGGDTDVMHSQIRKNPFGRRILQAEQYIYFDPFWFT